MTSALVNDAHFAPFLFCGVKCQIDYLDWFRNPRTTKLRHMVGPGWPKINSEIKYIVFGSHESRSWRRKWSLSLLN